MEILGIHHVAIICSDYKRSKDFYSRILGFRILRETFRAERNSFKLDLEVPGGSQLELFSFPHPPARISRPEAQGLRHLAFAVKDLAASLEELNSHGISAEPVRIDEQTGKKFSFFTDPDDLPLEMYEI
jgi:glyoxylase I family protein